MFWDKKIAVFHFLWTLLRDLAVLPFWSELMTRFRALEIHTVHLTESIKETFLKAGDGITSIITLCLPSCPAFSTATADLQGSFSISNHPAPPAWLPWKAPQPSSGNAFITSTLTETAMSTAWIVIIAESSWKRRRGITLGPLWLLFLISPSQSLGEATSLL